MKEAKDSVCKYCWISDEVCFNTGDLVVTHLFDKQKAPVSILTVDCWEFFVVNTFHDFCFQEEEMKKELVEWEKEEQEERKENLELDEVREKSTPEMVSEFWLEQQ